MPVEMLTYAELGERLKISPEAARALVKRHRLPRSRSNDGKTLVQVDLTEISHSPVSRGPQAPAGHQVVTALKQQIETLHVELTEMEGDHGERFTTTFSAGVVSYPGDGTDIETLMRVADARLYSAKRQGKNRVVL